jgi:hypothetical protein
MQFDIKSAVVTNWPIKVTALALAAVLWAALSTGQPATQLVPVRLEIQTPEHRILATRDLPEVQALVGGSAGELVKLYRDPPVIIITIPDSVTDSIFTVDLSPEDVTLTSTAIVTLQDVRPRRLELPLADVRRRTVPVVSRVNIQPGPGFVFLGSSLAPESVSVIGPEALVRRIGSVYTVALRLSNVRNTIRRSVAIDTAGFGILRLSQWEVEIEGRVDQITTRTIPGVPVVIGSGVGVWGSQPATVQVAVQGPASRLAALTRDSLLVTAPAATAQDEMLPLSVRALSGLSTTVTPDSVRAQRIIR